MRFSDRYFLLLFLGGLDFLEPLFFPAVVVPPSNAMSFVPMGEPRPVQASQPGPAEKAPLLPEVMSRKADFALAA